MRRLIFTVFALASFPAIALTSSERIVLFGAAPIKSWSATDAIPAWATFSRADCSPSSNCASYIGSSTIMQFASVNQARIDYSLGAPAALLEPSKTVRNLYSNTFTNAAWTKLASTTGTGAAAPDGNASTRITMTAGSTQYPIYGTGFSAAGGETLTFFVFAKYTNSQWLWIRGDDVTNGPSTWAAFDIQNCAAGNKLASVASSGVISYAGGWCLCWLSVTQSGVNSASNAVFRVGNGSTPTNSATTQAGTESFDLFGANVVLSAYPMSYILSTSAAATRSADSFQVSGYASSPASVLMASESSRVFSCVNYASVTAMNTALSTFVGWVRSIKIWPVGSNGAHPC